VCEEAGFGLEVADASGAYIARQSGVE